MIDRLMRRFRSLDDSNILPDIRERLIVALDVKSRKEADAIVKSLGDLVVFYKIGSQFAYRGGIDYIKELNKQNKKVFVDTKIWDVSTTVKGAVEGIIAGRDVSYITVHMYRRGLEAAIEAASVYPNRPKIICVTVLTSMDKQDLIVDGYPDNVEVQELVLRRARAAKEMGADGVIASGLEAEAIRQELGSDFIIITPGIRMPWHEQNEQKRVTTPFDAIRSKADYIVVGRPIIRSTDPRGEAEKILADIRSAAEAHPRITSASIQLKRVLTPAPC